MPEEHSEKICERRADYVIGLKGNRPALLEDISLYFKHSQEELPCFVTKMKDHGRIEKREYRLLTDLSWLPQREEWAGLRAVGMATATMTRGGKTSVDTRYFLSSVIDVERLA